MYLIQNIKTREYVVQPYAQRPLGHPYTSNVEQAYKYKTRAAAQADLCDDERIVDTNTIMGGGKR